MVLGNSIVVHFVNLNFDEIVSQHLFVALLIMKIYASGKIFVILISSLFLISILC